MRPCLKQINPNNNKRTNVDWDSLQFPFSQLAPMLQNIHTYKLTKFSLFLRFKTQIEFLGEHESISVGGGIKHTHIGSTCKYVWTQQKACDLQTCWFPWFDFGWQLEKTKWRVQQATVDLVLQLPMRLQLFQKSCTPRVTWWPSKRQRPWPLWYLEEVVSSLRLSPLFWKMGNYSFSSKILRLRVQAFE